MSAESRVYQTPVLAPKVEGYMLESGFWIGLAADAGDLILNQTEIAELNRRSFQRMKEMGWQETLYNLEDYPEIITREELLETMVRYSGKKAFPGEKRYNQWGEEISTAEKEQILSRVNFSGIPEKIRVRFGILVEGQDVRAFPTETVFAPSPAQTDMDLFQLTRLSANTPVAVLHRSSDGKWSYIQSTIYRGWVKTKSIALAKDREQVFDFLNTDRFLVVTGSWVETEPNPFIPEISNISYQMGDRLPLADPGEIPESIPPDNQQAQSPEGCYVIKVPVRDKEGYLKVQLALIARSKDLHEGYLPYTRENLIRQAFKMLGERYGWGGKFKRRDCSRFVLDIYRTVGVILPRDTGTQEEGAAGKSIKFSGTAEEREMILAGLKPGDPLYLKGHVMIYLGRVGDNFYVIHDGSGYGVIDNQGEIKPVTVHGVFVMELHQLLKSGRKSYLEVLTTARQFQ